jgi:hypothetical protein
MILYQDRFGPEGRRNVRRIPAPAARGLSAAAVKCLSLVMLYLAKIDFQNRNCKVKNIPTLDQPWRRPPFSFCMPSSPSTQSSSIPFPTITREKMWMAAAVPAGRPPPPPPLSSPGWPPRYAIRGPSLFSRRLGRPLLYAAGSTSAAANFLHGGAVGWRLHHRHAASGIRVY